MIIVTGSVTVQPDNFAEALRLSVAHVERSREEPGCLSHKVTVDGENPSRLLFLERWDTMEALETHFQVPQSSEFVEAIAALASVPPEMQLYEAEEIKRH